MGSLPIIKNLYILKYASFSLFSSCKFMLINVLRLQSVEKTLYYCVIIAVAFTTHAQFYPIVLSQLFKIFACILTAPV